MVRANKRCTDAILRTGTLVATALLVAVTLLDLRLGLVKGRVVWVALLGILRHGEAVLDVDRIADVARILQLENRGLQFGHLI